jgi:protein TonB
MFETSVIQGQPRVAAGRLSLLTISLIAHTAVIVGAIAFSIASVDFPSTAPDEFSQAPVFLPLLVPPPLGNSNGGAVRPPQPVHPAVTAPQPPSNQLTAPSVVPDVVPQLAAPSTGNTTGPGDPNATVVGPIGVANGDPNSVSTDLNVPPGMAAAQPVPERIYEAREVKAPVPLFHPAPPYPQLLLKIKMRATVMVRCIIDKNGHVRDPQIIVPASMAPFNDAVVTTVRQWRFTPGSLNGQAVETYLDLTVNFAVN